MVTFSYTPNTQPLDSNGRVSVLSSQNQDNNLLHVVTNQYFSILISGLIQQGGRYGLNLSSLPNPILIPLLIVEISAEVDLTSSTQDTVIVDIQRLNEDEQYVTAYSERFQSSSVPIARAGLIIFPDELIILRAESRSFNNIVITGLGVAAHRVSIPANSVLLP